MKYYLIAGEASGDLHASNLMHALTIEDPKAEFRFFGGDLMQKQGGTLVKHYRDMAFMGGWEVLKNLGTISKNFKLCKADLLNYKPDVLILVDYGGFNLRMAAFAKKHGIKVFYYISPKIWAWREGRVKKIKAFVDRMFCILPFEVEFYKKHQYTVDYVGNPVMDAVEKSLANSQINQELIDEFGSDEKPLVALLAGSRKQEIERLLPVMIQVAESFPDFRFVLAGAPSIEPEMYQRYLANTSAVSVVYDKTYDLLKMSYAALVTSGTATLETALLNVPEVVVYKTNPFNYHVGKLFVKIKFFSLVNLIAGHEVVKELLQQNLYDGICLELSQLLYDDEYRDQMFKNYKQLRQTLGNEPVSSKTARLMVSYLTH